MNGGVGPAAARAWRAALRRPWVARPRSTGRRRRWSSPGSATGIDELDRRIVELLNERARLGRTAGRAKHLTGRRAIKDTEREREVLLRVAMANPGPLAQADLLSIYRRIVSATRGLESRDRSHDGRPGD